MKPEIQHVSFKVYLGTMFSILISVVGMTAWAVHQYDSLVDEIKSIRQQEQASMGNFIQVEDVRYTAFSDRISMIEERLNKRWGND